MATIQSLIDGFEAAVNPVTPATVPITPAALGTGVALQFISLDDVAGSARRLQRDLCVRRQPVRCGQHLARDLGHAAGCNGVYSGGRFTNGNVWVQDLAQNLGLARRNRAWRAEPIMLMAGRRPGRPRPCRQPVRFAVAAWAVCRFGANPSPTALYTVWAGSNDVLDIANSTETPAQQQATVQQAVNNEASFIDGLIAHGAKNLVVMGVPDLGSNAL